MLKYIELLNIIPIINILVVIYFLKFVLFQDKKNIYPKLLNTWAINTITLVIINLYFFTKFKDIIINAQSDNELEQYIAIILLVISILSTGFVYGIQIIKNKLNNNQQQLYILSEINITQIISLLDNIKYLIINIILILLVSIEYLNIIFFSNDANIDLKNSILSIITSILFFLIIGKYKQNYKNGGILYKFCYILNIIIYLNFIIFNLSYNRYGNFLELAFLIHTAIILSIISNEKFTKLDNFISKYFFINTTKKEINKELDIFTNQKVHYQNVSENITLFGNYGRNFETTSTKKINLSSLKNTSNYINIKNNNIRIR